MDHDVKSRSPAPSVAPAVEEPLDVPVAHARGLLPDNPLRPLAWRWHAADLPDYRRKAARMLGRDPWVRRIRRWRREAEAHGSYAGARSLKLDPDLAAAYRLRTLADGWPRLALECRILAGEDDRAIAAKLGLGRDVVEAYKATFFAVRASLHSPIWALAHFFPAASAGRTLADLVRQFCHAGGPVVADLVIGMLEADLGGCPAPDAGTETLGLGSRSLMALQLLPLGDPRVQLRVLKHFVGPHARSGAAVPAAGLRLELELRGELEGLYR